MKKAIWTLAMILPLFALGCGEDGKDGADGLPGTDGKDGEDGKDGVDGKDGKDGEDGERGTDGRDGVEGREGDAGMDGVNGVDGLEGEDGADGRDGSSVAETVNRWFIDGQRTVAAAPTYSDPKGAAKNIILFVGDGMGISTVTAARILDGQRRGESGEENRLSFETLPFAGLSKVYNTNQQTPDSAGTMTAMMSGVKTKAGVIGVEESVVRGDCESALDVPLVSALMLAETAGKATGVVSTARVTHATPAATYARSPERNWEDDADMDEADLSAGCADIASQLIDFPYGDGIEVAMGGGRRSFLPVSIEDPEDAGAFGLREDGRDLTAEWTEMPNAAFIWNRDQLRGIDLGATDHLLGLFERSHMEYNYDRLSDAGGEPSIGEMTSAAINLLKKDEDGFFLMVESGRIDHAHHAGNAARALDDTIAFAEAVRVAMEKTGDDTLIIVTADHSHVFTIAGYPTRGNPILGLVRSNDNSGMPSAEYAVDLDGMRYTTLGYTNGLGFAEDAGGDMRYDMAPDPGRKDLYGVDVESMNYHQEALVPLESESHAGEDVGVYSSGPGAHLLQGTFEQSFIFHVMNYAGNLAGQATP